MRQNKYQNAPLEQDGDQLKRLVSRWEMEEEKERVLIKDKEKDL